MKRRQSQGNPKVSAANREILTENCGRSLEKRGRSHGDLRFPASNGAFRVESGKPSQVRQSETPPESVSDSAATIGFPMKTAIRAWVEPRKTHRSKRRNPKAKPKPVPWRPQPYGERVLVFDTETTVDAAQRLLYGFFRLYERDRLIREGIIVADLLDHEAMIAISEYSAKCRLPIYSRERFVEEVFYPEVYAEGTLCVGFNLPFDLSRIAIHAGCGRGENRRKFRIQVTQRIRWHDLRIESASNRAAFIGFVPKRKLFDWEKPFFAGRFLDLSTLSGAFSGKRHSLRSAGKAFLAYTRKMQAPDLGKVDRRSLVYGRQDVRATWALYKALRVEYVRHPFATFANERRKPKLGRYMGQLYSSASIAKQYLRLLGIAPLLQKQPDFNRLHLGKAMAAYFGGRADVRVRKLDLPVRVLDFTAMYATIFCLQELHKLLAAPRLNVQAVTTETRGLVGQMASDNRLATLYDPKTWAKLNCLVLVDPNWAILPVRMCKADKDPYTIAVTPLQTPEGRWYTLADVLAAVLLGGPLPKIRRAIRFIPKGRHRPKETLFRGTVPLRSGDPFFKVIVEQRQVAKRAAKDDPDLAGLEMGLKQMAASGAYGINAEINVTPSDPHECLPGDVYSDITYPSDNVHDERPGAFANPILAGLITGGARLMLAMLECEVNRRGGTFAFCDTDSLAIPCSESPEGIPSLPESAIAEIIERFDALSPYDPQQVKHLLKLEYPEVPDLRCFAVSAKRYVLYRWRPGHRIQIVKASESALGAIIGRTRNETTAKLAGRIWLSILMQHFKVNPKQRHRAKPLIDFDVPLRRKFPISQPSILKRLEAYNKPRSYDFRVKPFGFVQSATPATKIGKDDLPIAPYEADLTKAKRLPWVDFNTGKPLRLDWHGSHMDGTLSVIRLNEYIELYHRHPEAKAADQNGNPAGADTVGLLGRLQVRSEKLVRIGKEVDRLDQDEGASLEPDQPVEYERDDLAADIEYLATFSQAATASDLGLTEPGWRKIIRVRPKSRATTLQRIKEIATLYRIGPSSARPLKRSFVEEA